MANVKTSIPKKIRAEFAELSPMVEDIILANVSPSELARIFMAQYRTSSSGSLVKACPSAPVWSGPVW
jgi:hypothetical protein